MLRNIFNERSRKVQLLMVVYLSQQLFVVLIESLNFLCPLRARLAQQGILLPYFCGHGNLDSSSPIDRPKNRWKNPSEMLFHRWKNYLVLGRVLEPLFPSVDISIIAKCGSRGILCFYLAQGNPPHYQMCPRSLNFCDLNFLRCIRMRITSFFFLTQKERSDVFH